MSKLSRDEARELAASVRAACDRLATEERVRKVAFGVDGKFRGFDTELWQALCGQVGVAAIALPEDLGGAGYGAAALGVVAHELGRALAPVPFLASAVLATGLVLDSGSAGQPEVADKVASFAQGERTAAAAVSADGGIWERNAVSLSASTDGEGFMLDGSIRHVLNGAAADDLVVVALVDGRPAIFLLDAAADGVTITAERVLDATRPMATVDLRGAAALRLGDGGPVDEVIAHNVQLGMAVLSAEQVGAHERVLEIATDYACTRHQFGRAIGSFQAIKHRCADMLVELEWSRSASQAALQSLDDEDGEIGWRAAMAKAVCSESLRNAAAANVQIHGGIGFTWEDSAHLYLKRARTDEVLFGGPGLHWNRLAAEAKLI
ncbi:acyl-CoA dehydrogenase family protein [Mycobacterium sp.]|uniref:acyl-CoA dehydrogenase family protein n=1 Tax=Mycobacterium sp. TaxID=1785 RepID=UPI003D12201B